MSSQSKKLQPEDESSNVNTLTSSGLPFASTYITPTEKKKSKGEIVSNQQDEASAKAICRIKNILGLQDGKIYTKKDLDLLPYGSIYNLED